MRRMLLLCLVVGCGSSNKKPPQDPAEAQRQADLRAAEERDKKIAAMKPASPYETRDKTAYRPTERCGQGPYHLETDSLRAHYGEEIVVYACGKHPIKGNYRFETKYSDISKPVSSEYAFGWTADNAGCKGREIGPATQGTGSGGTSTSAAGTGPVRTGTTAATPAKLTPQKLVHDDTIPEKCVESWIYDGIYESPNDTVGVDARFRIDIWSSEPMDLDDLVFVIERRAVRAGMTPDAWLAYRAADAAYDKAYRANLERDVASGRTTLIDSTVTAPPPPAPRAEKQPPRPSEHARWIPGYWLYDTGQFHWIAGLWDVPEEDLKRELTVQAPTPPPAAPAVAEVPTEPQPIRTAVWTPGGWQWDGVTYIWVPGAWRVPPDPNHVWQRSTWSVRSGRATFRPGGWRIRIR